MKEVEINVPIEDIDVVNGDKTYEGNVYFEEDSNFLAVANQTDKGYQVNLIRPGDVFNKGLDYLSVLTSGDDIGGQRNLTRPLGDYDLLPEDFSSPFQFLYQANGDPTSSSNTDAWVGQVHRGNKKYRNFYIEGTNQHDTSYLDQGEFIEFKGDLLLISESKEMSSDQNKHAFVFKYQDAKPIPKSFKLVKKFDEAAIDKGTAYTHLTEGSPTACVHDGELYLFYKVLDREDNSVFIQVYKTEDKDYTSWQNLGQFEIKNPHYQDGIGRYFRKFKMSSASNNNSIMLVFFGVQTVHWDCDGSPQNESVVDIRSYVSFDQGKTFRTKSDKKNSIQIVEGDAEKGFENVGVPGSFKDFFTPVARAYEHDNSSNSYSVTSYDQEWNVYNFDVYYDNNMGSYVIMKGGEPHNLADSENHYMDSYLIGIKTKPDNLFEWQRCFEYRVDDEATDIVVNMDFDFEYGRSDLDPYSYQIKSINVVPGEEINDLFMHVVEHEEDSTTGMTGTRQSIGVCHSTFTMIDNYQANSRRADRSPLRYSDKSHEDYIFCSSVINVEQNGLVSVGDRFDYKDEEFQIFQDWFVDAERDFLAATRWRNQLVSMFENSSEKKKFFTLQDYYDQSAEAWQHEFNYCSELGRIDDFGANLEVVEQSSSGNYSYKENYQQRSYNQFFGDYDSDTWALAKFENNHGGKRLGYPFIRASEVIRPGENDDHDNRVEFKSRFVVEFQSDAPVKTYGFGNNSSINVKADFFQAYMFNVPGDNNGEYINLVMDNDVSGYSTGDKGKVDLYTFQDGTTGGSGNYSHIGKLAEVDFDKKYEMILSFCERTTDNIDNNNKLVLYYREYGTDAWNRSELDLPRVVITGVAQQARSVNIGVDLRNWGSGNSDVEPAVNFYDFHMSSYNYGYAEFDQKNDAKPLTQDNLNYIKTSNPIDVFGNEVKLNDGSIISFDGSKTNYEGKVFKGKRAVSRNSSYNVLNNFSHSNFEFTNRYSELKKNFSLDGDAVEIVFDNKKRQNIDHLTLLHLYGCSSFQVLWGDYDGQNESWNNIAGDSSTSVLDTFSTKQLDVDNENGSFLNLNETFDDNQLKNRSVLGTDSSNNFIQQFLIKRNVDNVIELDTDVHTDCDKFFLMRNEVSFHLGVPKNNYKNFAIRFYSNFQETVSYRAIGEVVFGNKYSLKDILQDVTVSDSTEFSEKDGRENGLIYPPSIDGELFYKSLELDFGRVLKDNGNSRFLENLMFGLKEDNVHFPLIFYTTDTFSDFFDRRIENIYYGVLDDGGSFERSDYNVYESSFDFVAQKYTINRNSNLKNFPPISTDIVVDNSFPDRNEVINFEAKAKDPEGDNLTYTWDFNDGNTDSGKNVSHHYQDLGYFFVTCDIEDESNNVVTESVIIYVSLPHIADYNVTAPSSLEADKSGTVNIQALDEDGDPITHNDSMIIHLSDDEVFIDSSDHTVEYDTGSGFSNAPGEVRLIRGEASFDIRNSQEETINFNLLDEKNILKEFQVSFEGTFYKGLTASDSKKVWTALREDTLLTNDQEGYPGRTEEVGVPNDGDNVEYWADAGFQHCYFNFGGDDVNYVLPDSGLSGVEFVSSNTQEAWWIDKPDVFNLNNNYLGRFSSESFTFGMKVDLSNDTPTTDLFGHRYTSRGLHVSIKNDGSGDYLRVRLERQSDGTLVYNTDNIRNYIDTSTGETEIFIQQDVDSQTVVGYVDDNEVFNISTGSFDSSPPYGEPVTIGGDEESDNLNGVIRGLIIIEDLSVTRSNIMNWIDGGNL